MTIGIYYGSAVCWHGERWITQNRGLARFLAEIDRRGVNVILWAPEMGSLTAGYDLPQSVRVVSLPGFDRWWRGMLAACRLVRAFRREISKVESVWIRYPAPMGWALARIARRQQRRVLWDVVGNTREVVASGGHYPAAIRWIAGGVIRAEEALVHRHMQDEACMFVNSRLLELHQPPTDRTLVRFPGVLTEADFASGERGTSSDPIRLLTVAVLRPEKGIEYLLDALVQLGPRFGLDIVGDGPMRDVLEEKARSVAVERQVRFHGYVGNEEHLRRLYRDADIFVLPSVSEGTPRVLLEAMAAGLPVVATHVGGIPELVNDERNGMLAPASDAAALADAVTRIVNEPATWHRLVIAGLQTAGAYRVASFVDDALGLLGFGEGDGSEA